MLKPDKIYKYIAYTFWEHFFFLIAVQNTVQVPQKIHHNPPPPNPPAGQTACSCLCCENMRVGAQLCLQKCENVLFFSSSSFVGLSPWHSSIQCFVQSLFKDSQNWVFSHLFKWKSPPPPFPGLPGPWRDSISWALSCLQGRGGKKGSTLNTLWLKQWKMSSIWFSD